MFNQIYLMGVLISKKKKILLVGLDNSGKTTILNNLIKNKQEDITPTAGINIEKFDLNGIKYTAYDVSGMHKYCDLKEEKYAEVNAIIFVIDSNDIIRLKKAKTELKQLLSHISTQNVPILFFSNKIDIKTSLSPAEISKEMELSAIVDRNWNIFGSDAIANMGIKEGIKWLSTLLKK